MRYVRHISTRQTPQCAPIPGENQVMNSAGGFVYQLDKWSRLRRFLVLGSEGNTYYASEHALTKENAQCVIACIKEDGAKTISEIVEISFSGRAPKNDPAVFALALCTAYGDDATKQLACEALPKICRTGTHLFHFADTANELRGWGKMLKKAVATWYNSKNTHDLAFQVIKYKQRDGWSHRDLIRLAHISPIDETHNDIFNWVVKETSAEKFKKTDAEIIWASEEAKNADKNRVIELIEKHDIPREVVPTELLKDPDVWSAMLPSMGLTAMIRNLANMTRSGLINTGLSDAVKIIIEKITSTEQLARARVHPIQILSALVTYSSGRGGRSMGDRWTPNVRIVDALDTAFYKAFNSIEPTGKRYMLALDVSGSMCGGEVAGVPGLTPRVASAALAMVTLAVEDDTQTIAFTCDGPGAYISSNGTFWNGKNGVSPVDISSKRRLDDVVSYLDKMQFGGTDCSLPILYAMDRKIVTDVFVVYTDSETWAGNIHPSQALRKYREKFNPEAKLIVVGMVSNGFTIADPNDAGMLDVVGFDTATPALMANFAGGAI